jgi:hypothetical protein
MRISAKMAANQEPKLIVTTPVVTFGYTNLSSPDRKYDRYKVQLVASEDVLGGIRAEFDAFADENILPVKRKSKDYRPGYKVLEDGNLQFQPGTKSAVPVFDTKGRPVNAAKLNIGGGSCGRVKMELRASSGDKPGVTAYLKSVQLTKLVQYNGGGFEDISEGVDDEDAYFASDADVAEGQEFMNERAANFSKGAAAAPKYAVTSVDDAEDF